MYQALLALLASTLLTGVVEAKDKDDCLQRPASFSGIETLTYKRAKGAPGERIYISKDKSITCSDAHGVGCKMQFIIPGDVVAVSKTCGDNAFVQYIGERRITTGWVRASSLEVWQQIGDGQSRVFGDPAARVGHTRFELTRGNDLPVCEAYLQRLNETAFVAPAYCGRPESGSVPGFELLNRVYLTTAEINRISNTGVSEKFKLSTWRYDPPIDVDNDGRPDNVLVWNLDDVQEPHCGLDSGGASGLDTGFQMAIIMDSNNRLVDAAKTLDIFGDDDIKGAENISIRTQGNPRPLIREFPAYGSSMGLFRYHGVTYFDTFVRNKREREILSLEPSTLRVYLRKDRQTKAVCTLRTF